MKDFVNNKFEEFSYTNPIIFDQKKYINLSYNGVIPKEYSEIKSKLNNFSCGEFEFSIQEDISDKEITIFQSFKTGKFNDDLFKLQIVCHVLSRNNVKKIKYFSPFIPYTRQDKTYETKVSLGSKLVSNIIDNCGINEVITYDLHSPEIEGFFKCKVQNLSMIPKFINHIKEHHKPEETIILFPDAGSASRFKRFFEDQIFKIAIIDKSRAKNTITMNIFGDVKNKNVMIVDDMIDSGQTLIECAKLINKNEAKSINVYATHGIFSNNAIEKLDKSEIQKIVISNSVYLPKMEKKIHCIPIDIDF